MFTCQASKGLGSATRLRMGTYSTEGLRARSTPKSAHGSSLPTSYRPAIAPRHTAEVAVEQPPQRRRGRGSIFVDWLAVMVVFLSSHFPLCNEHTVTP